MSDGHKGLAHLAAEWEVARWSRSLREFLTDIRADAAALRRLREGDTPTRSELRTLTADTIDCIAGDLDAEITRLENQ